MVLPPVKMFDARVPPASAPAGYRAVAGYIGGDTPHVWTDAEWKRFGSLPKLPIWVRSDPAEVADYAGNGPFMYPHRLVKATRYANGPHYDSSLIKYWQYDWRLWK
jgi:hypothetical protein